MPRQIYYPLSKTEIKRMYYPRGVYRRKPYAVSKPIVMGLTAAQRLRAETNKARALARQLELGRQRMAAAAKYQVVYRKKYIKPYKSKENSIMASINRDATASLQKESSKLVYREQAAAAAAAAQPSAVSMRKRARSEFASAEEAMDRAAALGDMDEFDELDPEADHLDYAIAQQPMAA